MALRPQLGARFASSGRKCRGGIKAGQRAAKQNCGYFPIFCATRNSSGKKLRRSLLVFKDSCRMHSELGLILLGEEGTVLWANRAAEELLGYAPGELQMMSLPMIGASEDKSISGRFQPIGPVSAAFRSLQSGLETEAEGEARFPSKHEKRVAVYWKLWALPPARQRKQVLLAISETAQASQEGPITSGYRDVFEYAVEGIFRSTIEGQYLEVNPALAAMYGFSSPAELVSAFRDIGSQLYINPDRRSEFIRLILEQGIVTGFEAEVGRADGTVIWIAIFARIVLSATLEPLYIEGSVIDITGRKAAEVAMKRSEEQLREFATRTIQVREEERISVAREIHDELGQALTLLRIDLTWLGGKLTNCLDEETRKPLANKIGDMEQMVHWTLQTVRRIVSTLRPPLLDESGLGAAIEFHLADFAKRVAIRYEFETNLVSAVPADSATAVFRIFQEILTNIARHANASRIKVSFREVSSRLHLTVHDNGRGILQGDLRGMKSFGLLGMVERAAAMGGELEIVGSPRSGTTVTLTVPILNSLTGEVETAPVVQNESTG